MSGPWSATGGSRESPLCAASLQSREGGQLGNNWGWRCPEWDPLPSRKRSPVPHGTSREGAQSPSCPHSASAHGGVNPDRLFAASWQTGEGSSYWTDWLPWRATVTLASWPCSVHGGSQPPPSNAECLLASMMLYL